MEKMRMKAVLRLFAPAFLMFLPLAARSQIDVTLEMEHPSFLQFEPVMAFVSARNDSDSDLVIDEDKAGESAHLRIVVQKGRDEPAARINKQPCVRKLTVETGKTRDIMVDVSAWWDLTAMGRYIINATVERGGIAVQSNKKVIDVVAGIEIGALVKNAPGDARVTRKYSLRYWARGGGERLFLRADEVETGVNYGVFQLGPLVRVFKPEIKVDGEGNLTVLHQSAADCYTRSLFRSSGESVRFVDQTYHRITGEPYSFAPGR